MQLQNGIVSIINNAVFVNHLDMVLRILFEEEYRDRPHSDELADEIECKQSIAKLQASIPAQAEALSAEYAEEATALLRRHHGQSGKGKTPLASWCQCELVCLPKPSRKRKRYFFGCPAWQPTQAEETKRHCSHFKWLSSRQCEVLQLEPIG